MSANSITRRSLLGMVSTAAVAGAVPSIFAPQSAQAQLGQSNPSPPRKIPPTPSHAPSPSRTS
ncbi:twin-arginine translocation signal domain-containing protein [Tunturiibacter gelidiferens]|uniref:twin-arginine translocation signal domain-containing protein n=1 Tax=Tunturiibacter gelidiferens TaxID=3069689 RepID=UPI003D9BC486